MQKKKPKVVQVEVGFCKEVTPRDISFDEFRKAKRARKKKKERKKRLGYKQQTVLA